MRNNLITSSIKYTEIIITPEENAFHLWINMEKYTILQNYIILMSYLKNKYIFIQKILLITQKDDKTIYRDTTYLFNFTYLDFKLWLLHTLNTTNNTKETKLNTTDPTTEYYFKIYTKNIERITTHTQPKSLNPENFINEIIYDQNTDTPLKLLQNNKFHKNTNNT